MRTSLRRAGKISAAIEHAMADRSGGVSTVGSCASDHWDMSVHSKVSNDPMSWSGCGTPPTAYDTKSAAENWCQLSDLNSSFARQYAI